MDAHDHIKRILGPLDRRLRSMLMRGSVTAVDDSQDLQQLQVSRLEDETLDGCERVGQYGLTSVPPLGSEVIIGQIGSNADHQVILGVDDKSRPHPLSAGQVVIYDAGGTTIKLDAAGNVHITAPGTITLDGTAITLAGDTLVDGSLTVMGAAEVPSLGVTGNVVIGGTLNGHAP